MNNKFIFYRKPCGTHNIVWGYFFRGKCKAKFGSKVRVYLRGRGKRIIDSTDDGYRRFTRDLPLKYAEKVAIYITLKR